MFVNILEDIFVSSEVMFYSIQLYKNIVVLHAHKVYSVKRIAYKHELTAFAQYPIGNPIRVSGFR